MAPTLLVLAAGMGSRYGGLKQIDPVGPSGETVLDYAVFDAQRAGFGRVVFVIRKDFEELFRAKIGARYVGAWRSITFSSRSMRCRRALPCRPVAINHGHGACRLVRARGGERKIRRDQRR